MIRELPLLSAASPRRQDGIWFVGSAAVSVPTGLWDICDLGDLHTGHTQRLVTYASNASCRASTGPHGNRSERMNLENQNINNLLCTQRNSRRY